MKEQEFKNRVAEVMREEMQQPEIWLYISFADEVFRGAVIIKAHGITDALTKCNTLQINPHGEAWAHEIPEDMLPDIKYHNRILTKEEVQEFWPDAKSLREFKKEEEFDA